MGIAIIVMLNMRFVGLFLRSAAYNRRNYWKQLAAAKLATARVADST